VSIKKRTRYPNKKLYTIISTYYKTRKIEYSAEKKEFTTFENNVSSSIKRLILS
jgi:hypothetical protein